MRARGIRLAIFGPVEKPHSSVRRVLKMCEENYEKRKLDCALISASLEATWRVLNIQLTNKKSSTTDSFYSHMDKNKTFFYHEI